MPLICTSWELPVCGLALTLSPVPPPLVSPQISVVLVLLFLPTSPVTHGPGTEHIIQTCCLPHFKHPDNLDTTQWNEFFIVLPRGGSLWSRQSLWIVWFSSGNCQIIYKEEWNRHRSEGIQWVQGDHPNLEPGSKCYCGKKHVRNLSPSWQAFSLETQLLRGWGQGTVGELFRLDNKLRTSTPARGRRINFLFKSY